MDPERAAAFAEDLLDKEKLKNMTAADGTLPGGAHCLGGLRAGASDELVALWIFCVRQRVACLRAFAHAAVLCKQTGLLPFADPI